MSPAERRDLRERMQRVAAKPKKSRARRPAKGTAAVDEVTVRELPERRPSVNAAGQSRLDTALGWALWEFTAVPIRRWEWLKQLARGSAQEDDLSGD